MESVLIEHNYSNLNDPQNTKSLTFIQPNIYDKDFETLNSGYAVDVKVEENLNDFDNSRHDSQDFDVDLKDELGNNLQRDSAVNNFKSSHRDDLTPTDVCNDNSSNETNNPQLSYSSEIKKPCKKDNSDDVSTSKPHKRVYRRKKSHKCNTCEKLFTREKLLVLHQRSHMNVTHYVCNTCNKVFINKSVFVIHKRSHTDDKPFVCDICDIVFVQQSSLVAHRLIHVCRVCNKAYTDKILEIHKRIHAGSNVSEAFNDKTAFVALKHVNTSEKPFSCDVCGKIYIYEQAFVTHKLSHISEKSSVSDVDDEAFTDKSALGVNTSVHSRGEPYFCDACNKMNFHKDALVAHKLFYTGKPYTCDVCNRAFKQKASLQKHRIIHTGIKSFVCDVCDKKFGRKTTLVTHKMIHTGIKPYICDLCNKAFSHKRNLKSHKLVHTGYKPHVCDVCNKAFRQNHLLVTHRRIHTGNNPYVCDVCNKAFAQNHRLVKHRRTHTGDKSYVCEVCKRKFRLHEDFMTHKRIHTGD